MGALYNGRGESRAEALGLSSDAGSSAQNNLAGGNAPRWHAAGAGESAQRNVGAVWGISSQSWDGHGGNSLEFDDSDDQLQPARKWIRTAQRRVGRRACHGRPVAGQHAALRGHPGRSARCAGRAVAADARAGALL
ncbi:hypothetical protein G6F22_018894 [Rhizopus arrhizus]|nr:hypothetical protein G6F22_018894 [Rhizopus arrhizus]